jgi:hypothetical protein
MTMHPTTLRCAVCKIEVAIEDIKYHTPRDEQPTRIFCGPEHSHSYFMEKRNEKTNNNIKDINNPYGNRPINSSS